MLYKESDTPLGFYIVLFGKIVMHSKSLGAIGMVGIGDFIGEEILFEKTSDGKYIAPNGEKTSSLRQDTAYSEGDTYLLECYFDEWRKMKDVLILMKLRKDFLLIENHIKKCYYQKRAWRQIKGKMTGEVYKVIGKSDAISTTSEAKATPEKVNPAEQMIERLTSRQNVISSRGQGISSIKQGEMTPISRIIDDTDRFTRDQHEDRYQK